MAVGKAATHSCLTLIGEELKISVEQGRMVTTLNILFSVVVLRVAVYKLYWGWILD